MQQNTFKGYSLEEQNEIKTQAELYNQAYSDINTHGLKYSYSSIMNTIKEIIMKNSVDIILYGTFAFCLYMQKEKQENNVCNFMYTDYDIYMKDTSFDNFVQEIKNVITDKNNEVHVIALKPNLLYGLTKSYSILVNEIKVIDVSLIDKIHFMNKFKRSIIIDKLRIISPLEMAISMAKMSMLLDHPKWSKNYQKYLALRQKLIDCIEHYDCKNIEEVKKAEIQKANLQHTYKITNDIYLTNSNIYFSILDEHIFTLQEYHIEGILNEKDNILYFVINNPSDIFCIEYEDVDEEKIITNQFLEFLIPLCILYNEDEKDEDIKTTQKYFICQMISLFKSRKTAHSISKCSVKKIYEAKTEIDTKEKSRATIIIPNIKMSENSDIIYVNRNALKNFDLHYSWGYGIEYETEIHRKYKPGENDLKQFEIINRHWNNTYEFSNTDLNKNTHFEEYNDKIIKYLNNNLTSITINVDVALWYHIGTYIIDTFVGQEFRPYNDNDYKNFVETIKNKELPFSKDIFDNTVKKFFSAIRNNKENYFDFMSKMDVINDIHNKDKIVGEISNYIGEDCGHEELFTGTNCHFEIVTQKPYNLTVDTCIERLKKTAKKFLSYYKLIYNDAEYAQFCSYPFMMYYNENYKPLFKYNKSGSYHINITLPLVSVLNKDLGSFLIERSMLKHLKYARVLQLLTPLLIAYYGTPDFKAIYKEKFNDLPSGMYTRTSFRLLSSNMVASPLPCMCDLYKGFEPERTFSLKNDNNWYNLMIRDGLLVNYSTRKTNNIGLDFRRDLSKMRSNNMFGFEFRILDNFDCEHLRSLLYFLTFVADLTNIIDDNLYKLGNYHSTLSYFFYEATSYTNEQFNCLVWNFSFNDFVKTIMIDGLNTVINESITKIYHDIFFEVPKKLGLIEDVEYKQTQNPKLLLENINQQLINMCKRNQTKCLYTSMMTNFYLLSQMPELYCVNEAAIADYRKIVDKIGESKGGYYGTYEKFKHKYLFLKNM
jgi:hypothetical protein